MANVHILNVGDGDCTIIQHEDNKVTMIDCCHGSDSEDESHNPSNPNWFLNKLSVKGIFRFILTHPDMDHMGGLKLIHEKHPITNFWDIDNNKQLDGGHEDWECYQTLRKSKENPKALHYTDGSSTKYFAYDDSGKKLDDYIQILSPTSEMIKDANESQEWNDCSYVILYCIHSKKILFCGDAGDNTLKQILTKPEVKDIDILIAPHHGRKPENDDYSYLDVMNPKLVVCEQVDGEFVPKKEYENRGIKHIEKVSAFDITLNIQGNGTIVVMSTSKRYVDVCNSKRNIPQTRLALFLPYSTYVLDNLL